MSEPEASAWATERFGLQAGELRVRVVQAIGQAHERALRAHLAGELDSHDAYGNVVYAWQHELLAAIAQDMPGLTAQKPLGTKGSRFDLLVAGNVILYPWRYAKDRRTHRQDARMRTVSGLRRTVLSLGDETVDTQLTIESITVPEADLKAAYEDDVSMLKQLANRARTVVIGYASSPESGVFGLGWGDLELIDDDGAVHWSHWEGLPLSKPGDVLTTTLSRTLAGPTAVPDERASRFDNAPLDNDLGLVARSPLSPEPTHESKPTTPASGTADDAGSDQ